MRLPRFVRVFGRFVLCVSALTSFFGTLLYLSEAGMRRERMPACKWNALPLDEDHQYAVSWCKLTKDTVVLRLYELQKNRLVVERSYLHFDRPNFYWNSVGIGYDGQDGGDVISLPPSFIERLRAMLP